MWPHPWRYAAAAPMLSLPDSFGFKDVSGAGSTASEGRALEAIHKFLQDSPATTFDVQHPATPPNVALVEEERSSSTPLMLLGIMSGNEARRRMVACSWRHAREVRPYIQVVFVVGTTQPLATEWQFVLRGPEQISELHVNASEGLRVWRPTEEQRRRHQSFTGTFTTYLKQATFLRFAVSQRVPLIGRADDDAFISPHALLAYAAVLQHMPEPFYGGVFEWISWRAARLEATGFSYGLPEARGRAKAAHRNCSRSVPDPRSDAYDHACLGPFAYAKGPLLLMNAKAVRWLIDHPVFHRDMRRARDMAEGRVPTRKGRIDDDINLGYSMVRMRT